MAKVRITLTVLQTAHCPAGKGSRDWWDALSAGLVLRVTEKGARSWYSFFDSPVTGKRVRLRLGAVKVTDAETGLTLAQARQENIRVQGVVDAGLDPAIEREKVQAEERRRLEAERHALAQTTFKALADDYLENKQGLRASTIVQYRSVLDLEILPVLGNKLVQDMTALDFEVVVERVWRKGKLARARAVRTALGSIWGWARRTAKWRAVGVTRDLVSEINPELTKRGEPRKRKLTDDELKHLWAAVDGSNLGLPTKIAFKLTVLLGERSAELIEAPWSEIEALDSDVPRWALPAARNKGKADKVLPLPPLVTDLLRQLHACTGRTPWLIPSRLDAKAPAHTGLLIGALRHLRNQGHLTCAHFTPHDLRRTLANRMAEELDVSGEAIKAVLGHSRSDVTSVHYTQGQQLGMKLAALTAWERRVKQIVGLVPVADNVIPMMARA